MRYPFGLQLYSVRDHLDKDINAALRAVRDAGYEYVETAGFHGITPDEFIHALQRTGLKPVSMHVPYEAMLHQGEQVLRTCVKFSVSWIVIPWLGPQQCPDREQWIAAGARLNEIGAWLKKEGVCLCYHNHSHEFVPLPDGSVPFECLLSATESENLSIELDTCWAALAGEDVCGMLHRFKGRCPIIHVKDYIRSADNGMPRLTEVGRGLMPWEEILPAAEQAGVRWFLVEQDQSDTDSLESARVSAGYMRQWNEQPG
ncbi:MAG TPA: sugar phosphate isomerase/epimerase [Candidatus Hydrogenedentes bacterium]|nr:sugar phosphate isomerase/epimerase [Candidatus Hydrogenedentota bacterium]